MKRLAHLACLALAAALAGPARAETIRLDAPGFGVSHAGFARAIAQAKRTFAQEPDETVTIQIPAGTFDLSQTVGVRGVIDVTGVHPGAKGRLVIRGAGRDATRLVFDKGFSGVDWIFGRRVYRVTFADMTLASKQPTVSQGHVVSVAPGEVVLDIQDGFPSPGELFNAQSNQGRFLRRYTDSRTDPKLIDADPQVPWSRATQVSGARWRLDLKRRRQTPPWKPGDLLGIKSKPPANVYWFFGGSDIAFEDVAWAGRSRGTFRGGIGKIRISGCVVRRGPPVHGQVPCLSTPGGGPQLGHPIDPPSEGDLVENNRFEGTGDDAIALFNATGTVKDNVVIDSFCRGILLFKSPTVTLENNRLARCGVLHDDAGKLAGGVPSGPPTLQVVK